MSWLAADGRALWLPRPGRRGPIASHLLVAGTRHSTAKSQLKTAIRSRVEFFKPRPSCDRIRRSRGRIQGRAWGCTARRTTARARRLAALESGLQLRECLLCPVQIAHCRSCPTAAKSCSRWLLPNGFSLLNGPLWPSVTNALKSCNAFELFLTGGKVLSQLRDVALPLLIVLANLLIDRSRGRRTGLPFLPLRSRSRCRRKR